MSRAILFMLFILMSKSNASNVVGEAAKDFNVVVAATVPIPANSISAQAKHYANTFIAKFKNSFDNTQIDKLISSYGFSIIGRLDFGDNQPFESSHLRPAVDFNPNKETIYYLKHDGISKKDSIPSELSDELEDHESVEWFKQEEILERFKRVSLSIPNDPYFNDMWYMHNVGQSSGPAGVDINVIPVWDMNITGRNVVVSVLDDGIDYTHPDLYPNYDPKASYDFNDHDNDPRPRDEDSDNCHGTRCAGEVAAVANNGICGAGVAFNSKIGGVRMLDGSATDALEASSLGFRNDYIDIYINCWGPKDDGKTYGKPGPLASKALKQGVEKGRNGLGSIYVWATGNGGLTDDDCNCDGYTTSIYTISIGCIGDHGLSAYYTEKCSSTIAVTFNGASHREGKENKMVTTDLYHKCTSEFKGTSASAPLAAGIIALTLEANPKLTWRDIQHLIIQTAKITSPLDSGWKTNGAGLHFNHKFGFGRLDALAMVKAAKVWKPTLGKHLECTAYSDDYKRNIPNNDSLAKNFTIDACQGKDNHIRKLEHVVLSISFVHQRRGDISIDLISPSGTLSQMLSKRKYDSSDEGLDEWKFMTVHFWGENPTGTWTIIVQDNNHQSYLESDLLDNEDIAQKLIDSQKLKQTDYIESLKSQNQNFDVPYPEGVKRENVSKLKFDHKRSLVHLRSNSRFPGLSNLMSGISDSTIFDKLKLSEQKGSPRVQVSVGYDNPQIKCIGNKSCSGILLNFKLILYGTKD